MAMLVGMKSKDIEDFIAETVQKLFELQDKNAPDDEAINYLSERFDIYKELRLEHLAPIIFSHGRPMRIVIDDSVLIIEFEYNIMVELERVTGSE